MAEAKENIFLFVPNIIGFGRVLLAVISFYFMPTHCVLACSCYITSALLDAFDGHAARYFNQSTKFGAMLDQLTDRAGTACLMMTLATFYPAYTFWLQLSMAIDITCHWLYLHTVTLQGKTSHKFIDMSENPIMHVYYTNKTVLFCMCAGNEAFYAALYVMYFYTGPVGVGLGSEIWMSEEDGIPMDFLLEVGKVPTLPTWSKLPRDALAYSRMFLAGCVMGVGLFKLIALISLPVAVVKAGISVIHGIVASMNLATIDINERAKLAAEKPDKQN